MFSILIIIPIIIVIICLVYYNKLTPHKTNNIREIYTEGLDLLVSGKRVSAYKNFKNIIKQDSNNINAYLRLGQILREGGNSVKALKIHKSLFDHLRKNNLYVQIHYIPIYRHPFYKKFNFNYLAYPNCEDYYKRALSIPIYYDLKIKEIKEFVEEIKKFLK